MSGIHGSRWCSWIAHRLHWLAIASAFLALIETSFFGQAVSNPIFTIGFKINSLSWSHHGVYALIVTVSLIGWSWFKLHLRHHSNTELPSNFIDDIGSSMLPEITNNELRTNEYQFGIDLVRDEKQFSDFLSNIELAYPSGSRNPMNREARRRFYKKWMTSSSGYLGLISRVPSGGQSIPEHVGFLAACRVKYPYFCKLLRGDIRGIETTEDDLGDDRLPVQFIEIRHLYVRRGTASPAALLWAFRQMMDGLVPKSVHPVLYGHAVTETGENNYRSLGFRKYGETAYDKNPQFVLDSRDIWAEQTPTAKWVMKNLVRLRDP